MKCPPKLSLAHLWLWAASAVTMTAVAAESMPSAPPPVAKVFVMVLVGFGVVGAAIWRLPAMVGVVGYVVHWAKNDEKRALSAKM
eukprot:scaffold105968_cov61-Cyclotella_meneghiniana.AAC.1